MGKKREFYWPNVVISNTLEYYRSNTYPTFAEYIPTRSSLPKKIIVTRDEAKKWWNEINE